jgi:RND family efflux transporter MFP subunit
LPIVESDSAEGQIVSAYYLKHLASSASGPGKTLRKIGTLLLLAGTLTTGCSDSKEEREVVADSAQLRPLRLQTLHPAIREVSETITGTGTIGAAQTSNLGVVTPGIVERVFVKVGDRVKKDQPLFQTRKSDFEISVRLARAELAAAASRAEQARLDHERALELLAKDFISQAQLDTAVNAKKAAAAERRVADARLAQAEQRLVDTVVRAPYDGVITERNIDEGTYKSAQTFSADSAVLQIQEIKVVVAAVRVPEIYLGALSRGTPADLSIDGLQDTLRSEIFVINDKADPTSRSLDVRFALANYDYRIKPGLFVQAEIHLPERLAMLLNHDAVLDRQNSPHVFLAKDGVAQRRDIVLNDFDATGVEVVAGLNDEDFVLIGPDLSRLVDGTPLPEDINADR